MTNILCKQLFSGLFEVKAKRSSLEIVNIKRKKESVYTNHFNSEIDIYAEDLVHIVINLKEVYGKNDYKDLFRHFIYDAVDVYSKPFSRSYVNQIILDVIPPEESRLKRKERVKGATLDNFMQIKCKFRLVLVALIDFYNLAFRKVDINDYYNMKNDTRASPFFTPNKDISNPFDEDIQTTTDLHIHFDFILAQLVIPYNIYPVRDTPFLGMEELQYSRRRAVTDHRMSSNHHYGSFGMCRWLQQIMQVRSFMLFDDEKYLEESLVWSMICVFCDCSLDLDTVWNNSTAFTQIQRIGRIYDNDDVVMYEKLIKKLKLKKNNPCFPLVKNYVVDWTMPTTKNLVNMVKFVYDSTKEPYSEGYYVAGHCTAGMGRTGLMCTLLLMLQLRELNPLYCINLLKNEYRYHAFHEVAETILMEDQYKNTHWERLIPNLVEAHKIIHNDPKYLNRFRHFEQTELVNVSLFEEGGIRQLRPVKGKIRAAINYDMLKQYWPKMKPSNPNDLSEQFETLGFTATRKRHRHRNQTAKRQKTLKKMREQQHTQ